MLVYSQLLDQEASSRIRKDPDARNSVRVIGMFASASNLGKVSLVLFSPLNVANQALEQSVRNEGVCSCYIQLSVSLVQPY